MCQSNSSKTQSKGQVTRWQLLYPWDYDRGRDTRCFLILYCCQKGFLTKVQDSCLQFRMEEMLVKYGRWSENSFTSCFHGALPKGATGLGCPCPWVLHQCTSVDKRRKHWPQASLDCSRFPMKLISLPNYMLLLAAGVGSPIRAAGGQVAWDWYCSRNFRQIQDELISIGSLVLWPLTD